MNLFKYVIIKNNVKTVGKTLVNNDYCTCCADAEG